MVLFRATLNPFVYMFKLNFFFVSHAYFKIFRTELDPSDNESPYYMYFMY